MEMTAGDSIQVSDKIKHPASTTGENQVFSNYKTFIIALYSNFPLVSFRLNSFNIVALNCSLLFITNRKFLG